MAVSEKVSDDPGTQAMFENMPHDHQNIVVATIKILDERFAKIDRQFNEIKELLRRR